MSLAATCQESAPASTIGSLPSEPSPQKPKLEVRRLSVQECTVAELADKVPVAYLNAAANGDDRGPAFDFPALECAVVDVHLLRLLRDLTAVTGIINHEIGIAAQRDRPFARKQTEQP